MSQNTRIKNDILESRRFAYLHKRDKERFGILEAVDYKDARSYLGSSYRVRQVWLSEVPFDRAGKWEIVSSTFSDLT
jgi:hypothetical protein